MIGLTQFPANRMQYNHQLDMKIEREHIDQTIKF